MHMKIKSQDRLRTLIIAMVFFASLQSMHSMLSDLHGSLPSSMQSWQSENVPYDLRKSKSIFSTDLHNRVCVLLPQNLTKRSLIQKSLEKQLCRNTFISMHHCVGAQWRKIQNNWPFHSCSMIQNTQVS